MAAIRRDHPRLTIEFQQIDFAEQYTALRDAFVDFSFVMGPVPPDLISVEVGRSLRLLAIRRGDLRPGGGDAAALQSASVVLPNQMPTYEWRHAWTPSGVEGGPVFVVTEDSMEAMLSAVGAGRGVCVVPEYVSRFYPQPGVVFQQDPGLTPCSVEVAAMRSRQAEPLIAALVAAAERSRPAARTSRRPRPSSAPQAP